MDDSDFRRGDAMLHHWAEKWMELTQQSWGYPRETPEHAAQYGSRGTEPERLTRPESDAMVYSRAKLIHARIRELPDELQDVIVARYLERMRYSEIARECRISRETARDRIYIAVMSVARRFQRAA